MNEETTLGFKTVPRTGVIYVMHRAMERGFSYDSNDWANLGQGSPETGPLAGALARIERINILNGQNNYAPVAGLDELRQRIVDFYNQVFRQKHASKYTLENVAISGGGRSALTRLIAALGNINIGHFIPDYTAYEELLGIFNSFTPVPILLDAKDDYSISATELEREILGRGLQALLMSNPCNPTGQLVAGSQLKDFVGLARKYQCSFIFDECYSHYIYDGQNSGENRIVSAAEFVENVDADPIIIVDALTKNWRYPGWRIGWTVGPKSVIEAVTSAGSFIDGGANHPFQRSAVSLFDPAAVLQEAEAIQRLFSKKRQYMLERLRGLNIEVEAEPRGAFYVWANLSRLPSPFDDAVSFFEAGLERKVITVPGVFFDVNPDKRRIQARYKNHCRFSFGPEMAVLERGFDVLEKMIKGG